MTFKKKLFAIAATFSILFLLSCGPSKSQGESLSQAAFQSPDQTYYPKTWMHAMNGNLSKPGYTKDIDNDWDTEFVFTENSENNYWVQFELEQPTTLRSLQIETPARHGDGSLHISDDGINFEVAEEKLRRPRTGARTWAFSHEFDGVKAKYFRFVFTKPIGLKRFDLWSVPRFDHWLSMNAMERGRLTLTPQTRYGIRM